MPDRHGTSLSGAASLAWQSQLGDRNLYRPDRLLLVKQIWYRREGANTA